MGAEDDRLSSLKREIAGYAKHYPMRTMLILIDELIDPAASGGKPKSLRGAVDAFQKERFYEEVLEQIRGKRDAR